MGFVGLGWGGSPGVGGKHTGIVNSCSFPLLKDPLLKQRTSSGMDCAGTRAQNYVGICFDVQASKMIQHELCPNKNGSDRGFYLFSWECWHSPHRGLFSCFPGLPLILSHTPEQKHPFCGDGGQQSPKGHQHSLCVQSPRAQFLVIFWIWWGEQRVGEWGYRWELWPTATVNPSARNLTQAASESSQGMVLRAKFLSLEGQQLVYAAFDTTGGWKEARGEMRVKVKE